MTDRLSRTDWIDHGLRTLAESGIHAVKADPLAKALSVSRGSFYWHFRDLADFRAQLLQRWRERMTEQVIEAHPAGEAGNAGEDSLQQLIRRGFGTRQRLDHAVRAWAAEDEAVAKVVAGVDARRVGHIAELLQTAGIEPITAKARATFLYWAVLGQALVADPGLSELDGPAIDAIGQLISAPQAPC